MRNWNSEMEMLSSNASADHKQNNLSVLITEKKNSNCSFVNTFCMFSFCLEHQASVVQRITIFTNERGEWAKYSLQHEKTKFISSSHGVSFFLLYRLTSYLSPQFNVWSFIYLIALIVDWMWKSEKWRHLISATWEKRHSGPGCSFIWIFRMVYSRKHLCLHIKSIYTLDSFINPLNNWPRYNLPPTNNFKKHLFCLAAHSGTCSTELSRPQSYHSLVLFGNPSFSQVTFCQVAKEFQVIPSIFQKTAGILRKSYSFHNFTNCFRLGFLKQQNIQCRTVGCLYTT